MSQEPIKSAHAALLNDLDAMIQSTHYRMRRTVLINAENLILIQEKRIKELEAQIHGQTKAG